MKSTTLFGSVSVALVWQLMSVSAHAWTCTEPEKLPQLCSGSVSITCSKVHFGQGKCKGDDGSYTSDVKTKMDQFHTDGYNACQSAMGSYDGICQQSWFNPPTNQTCWEQASNPAGNVTCTDSGADPNNPQYVISADYSCQTLCNPSANPSPFGGCEYKEVE